MVQRSSEGLAEVCQQSPEPEPEKILPQSCSSSPAESKETSEGGSETPGTGAETEADELPVKEARMAQPHPEEWHRDTKLWNVSLEARRSVEPVRWSWNGVQEQQFQG